MTLTWPEGWPRTNPRDRRRGNFNRLAERNQYGYTPRRLVTLTEAWRDVAEECRRFDATDLRVDIDRPLKNDGAPKASGKQGDDPGTVVHFRLRGRPIVIACDRFTEPESNLRAIAIAIESKRRLLSYGFLDMEREFQGYAALPETIPTRAPCDVLGVSPDAPPEVVKAAFRALSLKHHPDSGGDADEFREVQRAYQAMVGGA